MKLFANLIVLGVSAGWVFAASAHEETPFPITPSGTLLDFPEKWGPASIRVVLPGAEALPNESPKVLVKIGSHETRLVPCFARLFLHPPATTIRASGSWYHDLSVSPPYLHVTISFRENRGLVDGYSLFFSMDSGGLLQVDKHEIEPDGAQRNIPLAGGLACEDPRLAVPYELQK